MELKCHTRAYRTCRQWRHFYVLKPGPKNVHRSKTKKKKTNTSNKLCKRRCGVMGKRDPQRECAYFEFGIRAKYFVIMRSATMPLLYSWNWSSKRSHRLRWNVSPLFRPHLTARQIQIIHICVSEWGDWVLCLWVCRSRKKWIYSFVFFGARVIHSLDAAGPGVHPHTWREKGSLNFTNTATTIRQYHL